MKSSPFRTVWFLSVVLVHPALSAQPANGADSANAGPEIAFASTVYDFGKVSAGEIVNHEFIFTNTGNAVLEIKDVHPSCGCTSPGNWTRSVEPGKTGTIPLQFNSTHFAGPVNKTATVTSNAKQQPVALLRLQGTIWKPIEVTPQMAILNAIVDSLSNTTALVRITSSLPEPITLSNPECVNHSFTAELKTIQPGKEFQLWISTVPPLKTTQQGTILIKTSSAKVPTISVSALAVVQPAMVVSPMQITLPPGSANSSFTSGVTIRNNTPEPLVLSDPAVNVPGVSVQVKEVQPGRVFAVSLVFPPGFTSPQGTNVALTLKTSDPQRPLIEVPVHQAMAPSLHAMQPHVPPPVSLSPPVPRPPLPGNP